MSPLEEAILMFRLPEPETIKALAKVRDKFIIVTELSVYVADKSYDGHLQIQRLGPFLTPDLEQP